MANGDQIFRTHKSYCVKLLDAITATDNNGVWVDCGEFTLGNIIVNAQGTGISIQVQASNDDPRPSNATAGAPVGSAVTTTGYTMIGLAACPRWIKAAGTVTTGPLTVIAYLRAQI